ncbi:MAG: SDR family NAD(P)-dependent oxidoreductase [Deltaproteobacteria bacterium]|nr:SDR family NAD(P)-dependent oxidoreductase [Deltaproteobacteria bacterium]
MSSQKSALIVGASRGLGLAIVEELLARGWSVIGTCRQGKPTPLHAVENERLAIETVDITRDDEIAALRSRLQGKSLDVLFVNAGVANAKGMGETVGEIAPDEFVKVMVTNALAPMRALEQLTANVGEGGVVGAMSSGQGSLTDNVRGGNDVYRASKAALNMLMRSFSVRHPDKAHLLLAPGWVQTDMGGAGARFTIAEVIKDLVDTLVAQQGRNGLHYVDRFDKPVNW